MRQSDAGPGGERSVHKTTEDFLRDWAFYEGLGGMGRDVKLSLYVLAI